MGHGFAWVFGRARELEGLGSVEGRCVSDFAGFFAVDLLDCTVLDYGLGFAEGEGIEEGKRTPLDTALAAVLALALCLPPMGAGDIDVSITVICNHARRRCLTARCCARNDWEQAFAAPLLAILRTSMGRAYCAAPWSFQSTDRLTFLTASFRRHRCCWTRCRVDSRRYVS